MLCLSCTGDPCGAPQALRNTHCYYWPLAFRCCRGEGLDLVLPRSQYGEPTRTFAKALMQNCLLDKHKAATVGGHLGCSWGTCTQG